MSVVERIGLQAPRVHSVPDYASTTGDEAIELCRMAGLHLDEWQALILRDALGEREDGRWAAFEVAVNVARQNGKGGILEARALTGLFLLGERMIIWSAHQFDTSLEAFRRLLELIESTPDFDRRVLRVSRSHGEEGIELRGGQRVRFRTRTKGGGRGFTGDCLILDEAMILPAPFHGALLPTLAAQSVYGNPQVWYAGSAVDQTVHEHGVVFASIRERGVAGGDPSLAYFEHSAEVRDDEGNEVTPDRVDEELAADQELWAQANPGLGIRIAAEHVEHELRSMDLRTFAVERLGIGDWPETGRNVQTVIDLDAWNALVDRDSRMVDPVCFAFDVSPDRARASIAAAGTRPDGLFHVEVVEDRAGTGWVVPRLVELRDRHRPAVIACDGKGPAGSLLPDLEVAGVEVRELSAGEHAQACGQLYDAVDQETVRHLGTAALRAAIKGAAKRPLGDAWAWARKSSAVNITPLVASTIAHWAARLPRPAAKSWRVY